MEFGKEVIVFKEEHSLNLEKYGHDLSKSPVVIRPLYWSIIVVHHSGPS